MQVQIFSKKSKKVLDIVLMLVYNKNQKGGEQRHEQAQAQAKQERRQEAQNPAPAQHTGSHRNSHRRDCEPHYRADSPANRTRRLRGQQGEGNLPHAKNYNASLVRRQVMTILILILIAISVGLSVMVIVQTIRHLWK